MITELAAAILLWRDFASEVLAVSKLANCVSFEYRTNNLSVFLPKATAGAGPRSQGNDLAIFFQKWHLSVNRCDEHWRIKLSSDIRICGTEIPRLIRLSDTFTNHGSPAHYPSYSALC